MIKTKIWEKLIKIYILRKYKYIILKLIKLRLGENVEKPQLVNFIAKVLEDSGFKVYKNFKTSQQVVDIYAILPTSMGDFGLVVACKNYDKEWEVGIDVLKEMEIIGKKLKASKVAVVTSSGFSSQAKRYAEERKIKLIDRNNLVTLAKKYSNKKKEEERPRLYRRDPTDIDSESFYNRDVNLDYIDNTSRDYYENPSNYTRRGNIKYVDDGFNYNRVSYSDDDMEYYDNEVGGLDLSQYDEYDDDLYRAEFLNKTPINRTSNTASLFANSLSQTHTPKRSFNPLSRSSKPADLSRRPKSPSSRGSSHRFMSPSENALSNYGQGPQESQPFGEIIKPILKYTPVMIAVVVIISYLVGFLIGKIVKVPTGILGMTELILALVLSYAIVLYADRDADIIVKGTIVFFVSLVILMILIVAL